jgi:protein arginine kinase
VTDVTLKSAFRNAWLKGNGPEGDIVVSSRMRLARNLNGFRFGGSMSEDEQSLLESHLRDRIVDSTFGDGIKYFNMNELSPLDQLVLLERHLISVEHFKADHLRGVACDESGTVSIMVNEEDHLRIQVLSAGLALKEQLDRINAIDDALAERLSFSFDTDFGYLTTCPTNVGTGLRVSVMLHLPALGLSKHIQKVFNAVRKVNLAVRGYRGEGSQALGDLYQISNQVTLGVSQDEVLADMSKVLPKVINYEREVRQVLLKDDRKVMEDKVFRAVALLRSARCMSSEEAMVHLSMVRMGIFVGMVDDVEIDTINKLFLIVQPGHLQKKVGRELKTEERDTERASLIRKELQNDTICDDD